MELLEASLFAVFVLVALVLAKTARADPLKRFPGPALARRTRLYRAYYDVVVGGGWIFHLRDLHERYGPVVRVGRNELHFTEPAAYAEIYNSPHRMRKEPDFYENGLVFAGLPSNIFHVSNPRAHSAIKSLFSSYFTKKTVLKLEAVVQERVDKLISQLLKNHKTSPVDMNHAYHSVSLDVISLYALRTSVDATSFPSFKHPAVVSVEETIGAIWVMRHFQRLRRISIMLPRWLTLYLMPAVKPQLQIREEIERLVDIAMVDSENHHGEADCDDLNVFYTILRNARVDGRLKNSSWVTRDQMIAEAMGFRVAGSDTIGNTCTIATWYLIRDDDIRGKLVKELTTAWPDKEKTMPLELLEKLPYLTAVIKESLRVSSGVVTPMPRMVPESGAVVAGHSVPPGTIVSIGNSFVHMNPDIFSDPERFYPERWLEDKGQKLDRYLVAFGKGPRTCIGINLAWSELYMILGNVFRKVDFHGKSSLWSELQYKEYFVPLYLRNILTTTVSERA